MTGKKFLLLLFWWLSDFIKLFRKLINNQKDSDSRSLLSNARRSPIALTDFSLLNGIYRRQRSLNVMILNLKAQSVNCAESLCRNVPSIRDDIRWMWLIENLQVWH